MRKTMIAINHKGLRIGESHHNAKFSNREIELMLELRALGFSYGKLAAKFEISKSHVRYICKGRWRCQLAAAFKTHETRRGHHDAA